MLVLEPHPGFQSTFMAPSGGLDSQESVHSAGDLGFIPRSGRSPRGVRGNAFQYSCLENPMDRGSWWATVHGVTKVAQDWVTSTHTHTGYQKKKINTQKSVAFLYSNNQRSEREIKERISFTITSKRIKHIRINLPKETKDLYSEKCKTLLKELKDDTNRWKVLPCSWIERINIVKMTSLPRQWEGNRQEGKGSPKGGNSLQVSGIFLSLKWQEETN